MINFKEIPEAIYALSGVCIGWGLNEISITIRNKRRQRKLIKALYNELSFNFGILKEAIAGSIILKNKYHGIRKNVFDKIMTEGILIGAGLKRITLDKLYKVYRSFDKLENSSDLFLEVNFIEEVNTAMKNLRKDIDSKNGFKKLLIFLKKKES
jgi:hypothetical protein